ncbi:hypothetical protein DOY81_010300 [Sarcophaga bullata]|nr:hypothetical protein DOY81_010300 [Sarcophaga bullata]
MTARNLLSQIGRILVLNSTNVIPRTAIRELKSTATFLTATNKKTNEYYSRHYSSQIINDIPIVTYEEIKQLSKYPKKLLIDVREPNELQETGKIPSSINIPLGQVAEELSANMDKGVFKAKYGRDKPDGNTEIIFHCKIGRRSQNAAELAKSLGYKNSKNYLGSWTEWAEKEGLNK